jgi:hypothetical protein
MQLTVLRAAQGQGRRRRRESASDGQYSLFAAASRPSGVDAGHFRRQAALCRRLSATLHQRELVELLDRLEDEFENAAERLEGRVAPDAARI